MRLFTTLPIAGRNLYIRPAIVPLALARNASRLSGIHDGLRRSERARPQGSNPYPKWEVRQDSHEDEYLSPAERRRARAAARRDPINFKIKKGKKDITEPVGPPRRRRHQRLSDPQDPLGGESLLKRFKTGKLLKELKVAEREGPDELKNDNIGHDDFARQMLAEDVEELMNSRKTTRPLIKRSRPQKKPRDSRIGDLERSDQGRRDRDAIYVEKRFERSSQDGDRRSRGEIASARDRHQNDGFREDERRGRGTLREEYGFDRKQLGGETPRDARNFDRSDSRGHDTEVSFGAGEFERAGRHERPSETRNENVDSIDEDKKEKAKKKYEPPLSIPYTTAASQFLYGTSTVEAALSTSRRKLYKLYIYQGGNRTRQDKDRFLEDLAHRKGVQVDYVDESRLSLLNKMSGSRPHNGHVLEASPLPQLPVTALGEVSGEKSWPGFRVALGHQSAEDVKINGTAEFIVTEPSSHKPFVLLLDEIVDPQNLGAIIRTASFMGVTAVVTSKRGSSPVTPVVLKASSGAAEAMTMLSVDSPVDFVQASKQNGWRVYAAVPPKIDGSRQQVDMRHLEKGDPLLNEPCLLILGSEGEGLSRQLRRSADCEVSIPNMSGSKIVDSLNVSVATGLLCSAFVKGRTIMQNSGVEDAGALF